MQMLGVDFDVCVTVGIIQLTGLPANGIWSGNGITPTGLYNPTAAGTYDFTYSFGSSNCLTTDVVSLTVNALPIVAAGNDTTLCDQPGTVQFNGLPLGGYMVRNSHQFIWRF